MNGSGRNETGDDHNNNVNCGPSIHSVFLLPLWSRHCLFPICCCGFVVPFVYIVIHSHCRWYHHHHHPPKISFAPSSSSPFPSAAAAPIVPKGSFAMKDSPLALAKEKVYLHLYSRYLFIIILLLLLRGMNKLSIYCYTCEWYNHGYGVWTTSGNNGLFEINISKRFLLVPAMDIPRCSRFTHPPRDGDDDDWPITRNHDAA